MKKRFKAETGGIAMNKTKRQLFDELKEMKKERKLLNEWLYDDDDEFDKRKLITSYKRINLITKIIIFISIFLLTMSFFIMGVIWSA